MTVNFGLDLAVLALSRLSIQNNMLIMLAESRSLRRKLVRHSVDAGLCFLWFLGGDGPWRRSPVGKCPLRRVRRLLANRSAPLVIPTLPMVTVCRIAIGIGRGEGGAK